MRIISITHPNEIVRTVDSLKAAKANTTTSIVCEQEHGDGCFLSINFASQCTKTETKCIQATDLGDLIAFSPAPLKTLNLRHVAVVGDFSAVTAAFMLPFARRLKRLSMDCVWLAPDDMEALGQVLANLPMLESVYCHFPFSLKGSFNDSTVTMPWSVLKPIVQDPFSSVQRIWLAKFSLPTFGSSAETNAFFYRFFRACGHLKNLRELEYDSLLGNEILPSVAHMIRTTGSLKYLRFHITDEASLDQVAAALQDNHTLTTLRIGGNRSELTKYELFAFHFFWKSNDGLRLSKLDMNLLGKEYCLGPFPLITSSTGGTRLSKTEPEGSSKSEDSRFPRQESVGVSPCQPASFKRKFVDGPPRRIRPNVGDCHRERRMSYRDSGCVQAFPQS